MRRNQAVLAITDEQRSELSKWAQSRTLPAGDVFSRSADFGIGRGRELSADHLTTLQTTAPTISRWKQLGLSKMGSTGWPHAAQGQPAARGRCGGAGIASRKTQQKPADGSTHWSCRKMAAALGLSKSTVQRVWAQMRLKPHRLDGYMVSNDPRFERESCRHYWSVHESAPTRGCILRR